MPKQARFPYLWIPVTGTVAALLVVMITRRPHEGTPPRPEGPPAAASQEPQPDLPSNLPGEGEAEPVPPVPPAPPPETAPRQWFFTLQPDGAILDADSEERFASAADVVEMLKARSGPRPIVMLRQGAEVTESQLEDAASALRTLCDVRILRRDNQEKNRGD